MPGSHPANHKRRRRIRDTSEVSCCLKYVIFGFNVIFWVSSEQRVTIQLIIIKITLGIELNIAMFFSCWDSECWLLESGPGRRRTPSTT